MTSATGCQWLAWF